MDVVKTAIGSFANELQSFLSVYPPWLQILFVVGGIGSVSWIVYRLIGKLKRRNNRSMRLIETSKGKNKLYLFYYLFSHTPIIKRYFEKIRRKVEEQYPADLMSINKKATEYMLKALMKMVAVMVFALFVAKGDLYTICVGIIVSVVIGMNDVNSKLRKFEILLLEQLLPAISSIRHYSTEEVGVPDTIARAMDDVEYEVGLHLQKIHKITSSSFMEQELDEYVETSPNKFLLLLTSVCATIEKYGNKKTENSDAFLEGLKKVKEDVGIELLKRKNIENLFMGLTTFALMPILFLKPIEMWASATMKELLNTYHGTYGTVVLVLIMIIEIICYLLINVYMTSEKEKVKENSIWIKISNTPGISKILNAYINKHYTQSVRMNKNLRAIGDQTGAKAFLCKRVALAIVSFLLVIVVTQTSIVKERINTIASFEDSFNEAVVPNRAYIKTMEETAKDTAEMNQHLKVRPNKEELVQNIMQETEIKNKTHAETVAMVVLDKLQQRDHIFYRWYYLIIAVLGGCIGFYIPKRYVLFKLKTVNLNMKDETMQFQSITLILMNIQGMNAETVLEWMERFSYCFKTSIIKCQMSINQDEEEALATLREEAQADYPPFAQFVDNLRKIDGVGMVKAFDEIQVDREYLKDERKSENERLTKLKAKKAGRIAFMPSAAVILLYLIAPMVALASKMLEKMLTLL